jgi:hypothetical protein
VWYIENRWHNRLLAEQALMEDRFPQFRLIRMPGGELAWVGYLRPTGGSEYLVSLTYPARYPYREPKLRVERPRLRDNAPHTYLDQSLCVHRSSWDPQRSTAVSEVPLIAAWLVAYENWVRTGEGF